VNVGARLRRAAEELTKEAENLRIRGQLQAAVEEKIGKSQRDFFLREQLKAIQKELGEESPETKVITELRAKIEAVRMSEAAKNEALHDSRPSPHLRRGAAGPDHSGVAARGDQRPGVHARRDRQARQ